MKVKWTTEPPSEPGLYWVKSSIDSIPRAVEFIFAYRSVFVLELGIGGVQGAQGWLDRPGFERTTEPLTVPTGTNKEVMK